mgnify:CR=1 FL=1
MAAEIDKITIEYEQDGQLLVKELDKEILSRGAWCTILFRYTQWDKKNSDFGPERFSIRRYRKINGEYMQQSKFTISSESQAQKIVDTLSGWIG